MTGERIFSSCTALERALDSAHGPATAATIDGRAGRAWRRSPVKLTTKNLLLLAAIVCFAIAVIIGLDIVTIDTKIHWTDLGLLFGFGAFLFK
jgi:hypothetical protein